MEVSCGPAISYSPLSHGDIEHDEQDETRAGAVTMAGAQQKQALFYRNVVPLSRERHRDWFLDVAQGYHFTGDTNSIYLTGTEFPVAAREYPIVFAKDADGKLVPVAMLGLRQNQNLMVAADGAWRGSYIPAYIRRYPFILANNGQDPNSFAVCVDESYSGFNTAGEGERVITDTGEYAETVSKSVKFLEEFHRHSEITGTFCDAVAAADLVESMQANISLKSGTSFALAGLFCVPRNKIKAMPPALLKDFVDRDYLDLLYLHIYSLSNLDRLIERYDAALAAGGRLSTK